MAANLNARERELLCKELNKLNKTVLIDIILTQSAPKDVTSDVVKKYLCDLFGTVAKADQPFSEIAGVCSRVCGEAGAGDAAGPKGSECSVLVTKVQALKKEIALLEKLNGCLESRLSDQQCIIDLLRAGDKKAEDGLPKKQTRSDKKPDTAVRRKDDSTDNHLNYLDGAVRPKQRQKEIDMQCPGVSLNYAQVVQDTEADRKRTLELKPGKSDRDRQSEKPRVDSDRRRPAIVGSNSTVNSVVRTVPRNGYLHLYRMHPDTSDGDVIEFLKKTAPEIEFKCETLRKGEYSTSFRLTYPIQYVDKVYSGELWPAGAAVRRYYWTKNTDLPDKTTERE